MKNTLSIGFITPEYVTENYFSGGLANYVHRVAKALVSLGHEVHVITFSEIDEAEFDHEGVQVHRVAVGKLHKWLNKLTRYRINSTTKWFDFSIQAYNKLKQLNQQQPFDIVQFPNSRACGLVPGFLLRVPYATRISCYRPVWNEQAGLKRNLDAKATEWLEWLQLRFSQHIYAPSYTLQKILAQEANIRNVQVIRTPFYLETTDWNSSVYDASLKDKDYLLFFGRFQLHKGFHILAQALPQVLEKHPDCHAVFVGLDIPSSLAPSMKEYALNLSGKYADRLIFIGQTPHSQLYPNITSAKLLVLPSLIDNLPNACLEAMALGKPVIGTIGASFDELINDEKTGFLVPSGDVNALAQKIIEAWQHPKLYEIGQDAKQKLEEFAPERTVEDLLNYYKGILDKKSNSTLQSKSHIPASNNTIIAQTNYKTEAPKSTSAAQPDPINIITFKDNAIIYWLSLWDEKTGGFRFASHQPATLMATAYCVLALEFTQGLSKLNNIQKSAVISFLMAAVQPDGSFRDSLFRTEDILTTEHDLTYFQEETTTICQQALDALQAFPPPERVWSKGWDTADGLIKYFESIPWENPWLDSNRVMFALSQLCHDAERHQKPELLNVVDVALDWLDAHQSPETGLWQGLHEVPLTNAMAATFHFTFYYGYRHRPLQYVERIIDSCLKLQEPHGLFCGDAVGQTCLDYDALDLLAKASLTTDYRQSEVQQAMLRAYNALLGLHNPIDGGFANCKERITRPGNGKKGKILRKLGLSKFIPAPIRVPVEGTYNVCWRFLSCEMAHSNAFSTWFRLLGLRLSTQQQWLSNNSTKEFTFRRLPFLGYHDPLAVQSSTKLNSVKVI